MKFHYLKLIYSPAFSETKGEKARRKYSISILKKIADDEIASDRNKRMHGQEKKRFGSPGLEMKQMIPLSSLPPTRRSTAIPSFHPHICPFHRDAPIEFDATVDVIREIHFSYEVVFPVVIVDVGWWWIPGDSFRTDGSRWSWDEGEHHFTDLVPRIFSFLFSLSLSLFRCGSLREWKGNILPERPRFSSSLAPFSLFVGFFWFPLYLDVVLSPFSLGFNALSWFVVTRGYGCKHDLE